MLIKKLLQKRGGIGTDSSCGVANHANIPSAVEAEKTVKAIPKMDFK
jgi:hypothetical protein